MRACTSSRSVGSCAMSAWASSTAWASPPASCPRLLRSSATAASAACTACFASSAEPSRAPSTVRRAGPPSGARGRGQRHGRRRFRAVRTFETPSSHARLRWGGSFGAQRHGTDHARAAVQHTTPIRVDKQTHPGIKIQKQMPVCVWRHRAAVRGDIRQMSCPSDVRSAPTRARRRGPMYAPERHQRIVEQARAAGPGRRQGPRRAARGHAGDHPPRPDRASSAAGSSAVPTAVRSRSSGSPCTPASATAAASTRPRRWSSPRPPSRSCPRTARS